MNLAALATGDPAPISSRRVNALTNLRHNLKRLRKLHGFTQERVAEKAGLDFRHYQRIESGKWPGLQLRQQARWNLWSAAA